MRLSSQDEAFDRAGGLSGRRFRYATNFSGFAAECLRNTKPEKCLLTGLSGLVDGGLKGRLQARLSATQGSRPHATKGQTPGASALAWTS